MTPTADAQPVLIVVAGPNGAGKTTLTREILNHEWIEGCVYDNSVENVLPALQFRTVRGEVRRVYATDHHWADALRARVPHSRRCKPIAGHLDGLSL